jgi:creatinine amidohydrolase/Fe(II)-dependent formamide hydrolase-like protein
MEVDMHGTTLSLTILLLLSVHGVSAQILRLSELNTDQIRALDQQKTVVIVPGGILEEHGPYLPCYTDGYSDMAYSEALARTIVARPGWTVVLFPQIPIGSNPANEIGNKWPFPGSFAVRMTTVRALYMDLADDFGLQGFRWIFLIHKHGGPGNNRALDQASDYFHDIYGGTMVHLFGIEVIAEESDRVQQQVLTGAQLKENGLSVHADASETSDLLFIRPDLVSSNYRQARTVTGATFSDLRALASRDDWPGYFGAPQIATASQGAKQFEAGMAITSKYALEILDGYDYRTLPRYGDKIPDALLPGGDPAVFKQESAQAERQQRWVTAHVALKH